MRLSKPENLPITHSKIYGKDRIAGLSLYTFQYACSGQDRIKSETNY